jgi:hypothetical protein
VTEPGPAMSPIAGRRCAWSMTDRDGYAYPHDIKATHQVLGTNDECLDGVYCRRHARQALARAAEEHADDC